MSNKRDADGSTSNPITDDQVTALEASQKEVDRLEIAADRYRYKILIPQYEKRRELLKTVPGFWLTTIQNAPILAHLSAAEDDVKALQFLTEVHGWRDPEEVRAFGFEFHFAPNPFFSNSVLRKEYKYVAPTDKEATTKDEMGVSKACLDFKFDLNTNPVTMTIDWKDATKNLTKLHPVVRDPDDLEDIVEPGSFFHLFEEKNPHGEFENEVIDVYENAINFFFNRADGALGAFDEDDSEEDDDSGDEDIDLENPKKKAKK